MQSQILSSAPLPPPQRSVLSKWWPISFFITAVIFFIIGGGLAGSSNSRYSYYGSNDMFYGGVGCLAIGGICKLVGWILLIVYCVQGHRRPQQTTATVTYVTAGSHPLTNYTAAPLHPTAGVSPPPPVLQSPMPMPPYSNPNPQMPMYPQQQGQGAVGKFCGQCGSAVSSPFCTHCGGAQV